MFGNKLRLLGRSKEAAPPARPVADASAAFPKGGLKKLINPAGRVALALLQRLVKAVSKEDFYRFIQGSCLVGSAIHMGKLDLQPRKSTLEMNRTVLFEPHSGADEAVESSEGLKHAIYPLVPGELAFGTGSVFTIGRTDGNTLIMPDYAISKKHAAIENKRGGYFLKDLGSTNGTFLNGQRLADKALEMHDRDIVSFARYEFAFLSPEALYDMLRQG
jgi:hypothetical protein